MKALEAAVQALPEHVRTAMFISANKQTIRRGTWEGCAFNAASGMTGDHINAAYFEIPYTLVVKFIKAWDRSWTIWPSNVDATEALKRILLEAGINQDLKVIMPSDSWKVKKSTYIKGVKATKVFKNEEMEQFNKAAADMIAEFGKYEPVSVEQEAVEEIEKIFASC